LKILSAEFVTSAAAGGRADGIPRDGRAQIALAGRSNVGKSTLINALCRQKIARTSAAPGKTRLANIYRITLDGGGGPGRWDVYFVDLPGYGYARGGGESAQELAAVAEAYFSAATTAETLLLVDSRHPGLAADTHAHEWLMRVGPTPHIVGTKVDKLSRTERTRNFKELKHVFGSAALPVSAATGEGLDDLWKLIVGHRRTATEDRPPENGHGHRRTPKNPEDPGRSTQTDPGNRHTTEEKR
jgi:GTP-binding protein